MINMNAKVIVFLTLFVILISGCVENEKPSVTTSTTPSVLKIEPINLSIKTERFDFAKYYFLEPLEIELKASQYNLPLKTDEIYNFRDFSDKISLNDKELSLLKRDGFVIIENPFNQNEDHITRPYKILKENDLPIFITSDSLLHIYHIQFDETLKEIEEREFYNRLWNISKKLMEDSMEGYENSDGDLKEAYKRNTGYFSVALRLLNPNFEIPDFVKEDVERELNLIEGHEGFSNSPIFIYKEDYSQYIPRGHYTRSEKLKNYFKAMMWYGRMSMLLKGTDQVRAGESCDNFPPCKALISLYDAKIQTIQAV